MRSKSQILRLVFTVMLIAGVSICAWLVVHALRENLSLYFTPTDFKVGKVSLMTPTRFGGVVQENSFERLGDLKVRFVITDYENDLPVFYEGVLPDLFKEGQGVVVSGYVDDHGVIQASELLAKHDENYMPPAIKKPPPRAYLDRQKLKEFRKTLPKIPAVDKPS